MVERSRPWTGTVPGDAGPYSDDQWTDVWKAVGPIIARQGVFLDQLNQLDLSGLPTTPVSIDSGRALVNGIWYESDASVSLAIANATAGNVRVDRIVLRADWALQTVRLTVVEGANVAAATAFTDVPPPALVQVDGVTWDLPLWQVHVTDAGVISFFRDERAFIGQYEPSEPTDELVYFADDMFWSTSPITATADFHPWRVQVLNSYSLRAAPGFGRGVVALRCTGAVAGDVSIMCQSHRPDLTDAHTIIRAKNPNSAVTLDRIIGYVATTAVLTPANMVAFRADGTGAANWFAVCRAAGVETAVDTGQATDNVWRKYEMRQNAQNVVTFLIDDVVVATIQDDIPAAELLLGGEIFDDGAAPAVNDYLELDRFRVAATR